MDELNVEAARRDRATEIITSGRITSAVWFVAWPTIGSTLILTLYNLVNRAFLGHLKTGASGALAAVGIGGAVLNIQFALMVGLSVGTSALVSQFIGGGKHRDADEATRQSLILSIVVGMLSSIPFVIWAAPISRLMGAKPDVLPLASQYIAIVACSSGLVFIYTIVTAALRSAGDVRTPLYIGAVVIILNILFDWVLIFGLGPVNGMGVLGAAISTGISRVAGTVLILWALKRSALGRSLNHLIPQRDWFGRIMNIGWPAMLGNLVWTGAAVVLVAMLGALKQSTDAIAALTNGLTIEAIAYMPGVAYSTAAAPLVGQNLGAGKPERAERIAWTSSWQAVAIMTVIGVLFLVMPRQLALLLTGDEAVVALTASYLMINAVSEPFLALGMTLRGALQGAGDVRVPMWIAVFTFWGVRLPLVWFLSERLGMGANGAWLAISGSTILSGLITVAWFKTGRWKTIVV